MTDQTYGSVPRDVLKSMSGLDFLQAMIDGKLPRAPIGRLMEFSPVAVSKGFFAFEGTPGAQHYNPIGSVHGGYAATLLDSCMGCAVQSTLAQGWGYTTLEFKINFLRGMTTETGVVRAEGTVISSGRRVATADGRLLDSQGRILATGTTTCLVMEL